jgi:hypothetical protein
VTRGQPAVARRGRRRPLQGHALGRRSWIGRVYNVRNALLVVVGDVDPRDVVACAEVLLGDVFEPEQALVLSGF